MCEGALVSDPVWQAAGGTELPGTTPTPGVAGRMTLCDTNATAMRFYRVQVVMP